MFSNLKNVFIGAGAVIALAPGASFATKLVDMPPSFYGFLTFVASVIGPAVFFIVYLARDALLRVGRSGLLALISLSTVGGLVAAYMTVDLAGQHIRTYRYVDPVEGEGVQEEKYFLPKHYSEELSEIVNGQHRGRIENAIKANPPHVFQLMAVDARPVARTILLYFVAAQSLLIFGFLLGGWASLARAEEDRTDKTTPREAQ